MTDLQSRLGLISEEDYAEMRGVTLRSLRNERVRGKGPPYTRHGQRVFYPLAALEKFNAQQTVVPTRAKTLIDGRQRRSGARA